MTFKLNEGDKLIIRTNDNEDIKITVRETTKVIEQPVYRFIVRETPRYKQVGNIIIIR